MKKIILMAILLLISNISYAKKISADVKVTYQFQYPFVSAKINSNIAKEFENYTVNKSLDMI